jgi:purine-nucleoside phosphorylase
MSLFEDLHEAVDQVRQLIGDRAPTVGIVLGSGLGDYAAKLTDAVTIAYGAIPHFPESGVDGHAGKLVVGKLGGLTVCAMQGRVHFYEGHDLRRVTFPVRALVRLGCKTLILTNAAGGINTTYAPGDLVLIGDHVNLLPEGPLRGFNDERVGPRFPDMTHAYDPALRALAHKVRPDLKEGVYVALPGPSYETPAEIRYLRAIGGDLAGMSTVPETIVARHMGARVLGISCVTNMAAGITGAALSHAEVTETAARVKDQFTRLLDGILHELAHEPAHER